MHNFIQHGTERHRHLLSNQLSLDLVSVIPTVVAKGTGLSLQARGFRQRTSIQGAPVGRAYQHQMSFPQNQHTKDTKKKQHSF